MISGAGGWLLRQPGRLGKPLRQSPVRNQWKMKYVTLSQPKMLGPILPAPGGGNVRRPLALAFRRHRTGDSFQEATDPERTHRGGRLMIKKPSAGGGYKRRGK